MRFIIVTALSALSALVVVTSGSALPSTNIARAPGSNIVIALSALSALFTVTDGSALPSTNIARVQGSNDVLPPLRDITVAFADRVSVLPSYAVTAADVANYTIVPYQWTGLVNGVNVFLNGTGPPDIAAQLDILYPGWVPDNATETDSMDASNLMERQGSIGGFACCPISNWRVANYANIWDVSTAYNANGGQTVVQPYSCNKPYCLNGASIQICCSGTPSAWRVGNWQIEQFGKLVASHQGCILGFDQYLCGQQFDTHGYNVIVQAC